MTSYYVLFVSLLVVTGCTKEVHFYEQFLKIVRTHANMNGELHIVE